MPTPRIAAAAVLVVFTLLFAGAARADGVVLFNTITTLNSTATGADSNLVGHQGGLTFVVGFPFVPTASGTASIATVRVQCASGCPAPVMLQIRTDAGGQPSGTVLGTASMTALSTPSDQHEGECGTVSPAPALSAGTMYWAVMSSTAGPNWRAWSNTAANVLDEEAGDRRDCGSRLVQLVYELRGVAGGEDGGEHGGGAQEGASVATFGPVGQAGWASTGA